MDPYEMEPLTETEKKISFVVFLLCFFVVPLTILAICW